MSSGSKKKISFNGNFSNSLPLFGNESCSREIDNCMKASTGSYNNHRQHNYHMHPDQTKSLQELQHEVGALLEFRDLVIETFPDLKNKISTTNSTIGSGVSSSSIILRREWEPGIRVRRKLNNIQREGSGSSNSGPAGLLIRSRSNSQSSRKENNLNKSSGENHGSVVIQDSGFSTETTSSKETHSAMSAVGRFSGDNSSDNELLNLLDIIHKKSYELHYNLLELPIKENESDETKVDGAETSKQKALEFGTISDIRNLRLERDNLLMRVSNLEAKLTLHAIKDSNYVENEGIGDNTKADVFSNEDESKYFKDSTVPDIYYDNNLLGGFQMRKLSSESRLKASNMSDESDDPNIESHSNNRRSISRQQNIPETDHKLFFKHFVNEIKNLGRLDGILNSNPNSKSTRVRSLDSNKITAILLENNVIELQRHLITTIIQNQILHQKLDYSTKSRNFLIRKLNKLKEEKDDLKFKVEEKNIELEGTRAQLRVVESKHLAKCDEEYSAMISSDDKQLSSYLYNTVRDSSEDAINLGNSSMKTITHLLFDEVHNSSSTESAQDQQEFVVKMDKPSEISSRHHARRPSKIPLPEGRVSLTNSKQSMERSLVKPKTTSLSNKTLNKSTGSLYYGSATFKSTESISTTPKKFSFTHSEVNDDWKNLSIDSKLRSSSIPIASKSNYTQSQSNSPLTKSTKEIMLSSSPSSKKRLSVSSLSKSESEKQQQQQVRNKSQYTKKKLSSESSEDLIPNTTTSAAALTSTTTSHQSTKFNTKRLNKRSGSYNYSVGSNSNINTLNNNNNNSVQMKKEDESTSSNTNLKNTLNYEPSTNETNRVKNFKSSIWNWLKI